MQMKIKLQVEHLFRMLTSLGKKHFKPDFHPFFCEITAFEWRLKTLLTDLKSTDVDQDLEQAEVGVHPIKPNYMNEENRGGGLFFSYLG